MATPCSEGPRGGAGVTVLSLTLPTQLPRLWGPFLAAPHGGSQRSVLPEGIKTEAPGPSLILAHSLGGALTIAIHSLFLREGTRKCVRLGPYQMLMSLRSTNTLVKGYSLIQQNLSKSLLRASQYARQATDCGGEQTTWRRQAQHSGARYSPLQAPCQSDALFSSKVLANLTNAAHPCAHTQLILSRDPGKQEPH